MSAEDRLVAHGAPVARAERDQEEFERAQLGVLEGMDRLRQHRGRGPEELERERRPPTRGRRLAPGLGEVEPQLELVAVVGHHEGLAEAAGEGVEREGFQHEGSPGRLARA